MARLITGGTTRDKPGQLDFVPLAGARAARAGRDRTGRPSLEGVRSVPLSRSPPPGRPAETVGIPTPAINTEISASSAPPPATVEISTRSGRTENLQSCGRPNGATFTAREARLPTSQSTRAVDAHWRYRRARAALTEGPRAFSPRTVMLRESKARPSQGVSTPEHQP